MALFLYCSLLTAIVLGTKTRTDPPLFGGRIKHVITIMLENRSFDHILGFTKADRNEVDGCLPSMGLNCSNPINATDNNSQLTYVGDGAVYIQPGDPDHSVSGTSLQLYNSYADNEANYYPSPNKGFIQSYSHYDKELNDGGAFIMECFNSTTLPIMSTLAEEFGLIDHWFAAIPGPTEPNRIFAMMGTSQGMAENYGPKLTEGFNGRNIFHMMDEYGPNVSNMKPEKWLSYFQDAPTSGFLNYVRLHAERARDIEMLLNDITNGTLPLFSWVDPGYYDIGPLDRASDQHPDHDVTKGEELLKKLYETLRASPRWNDTLLLIYYDEHGGFFDHVSPPNCPNPDGIDSIHVTPTFKFERLGLRVPAILVSPWIKKGLIAETPDSNGPQYCHGSMLHTLREQFAPDAPPFTNRTEWALTFENMINLDEPRTDCPKKLPNVPSSSYEGISFTPGLQKNNEYQINIAKSTAVLCDKLEEVNNHLSNQASAGLFVRECVKEWIS